MIPRRFSTIEKIGRQAMHVLIVDDEVNIRQTFSEFTRSAGFLPLTAKDGIEALEILMQEKDIAVIVSDMNMPKITGLALLTQVKKIRPDTVRIMITGYAELEMAIDAVNEGNIFRFLTKPIAKNAFLNAVSAGAEQYRLILAEKVLLEKTLQGSIKVLTELFNLIDPNIFGRANELREMVRQAAQALGGNNIWQIELAAMLAPIGFITLPDELQHKVFSGDPLSAEEQQLLQGVPEISYRLISHIPRLEPVAEIVRFAKKAYDGSGPPDQEIAGEQLPLGSRILKVLNDLAELEKKEYSFDIAIGLLQNRNGQYDEKIIQAIQQKQISFSSRSASNLLKRQTIGFSEIRLGDFLLSDITTVDGKLLLRAGNTLNRAQLEGLRNYARIKGLHEPLAIKQRIGKPMDDLP
jgi:response regulator RpfG family c-di-GMP phosphodiesterase